MVFYNIPKGGATYTSTFVLPNRRENLRPDYVQAVQAVQVVQAVSPYLLYIIMILLSFCFYVYCLAQYF